MPYITNKTLKNYNKPYQTIPNPTKPNKNLLKQYHTYHYQTIPIPTKPCQTEPKHAKPYKTLKNPIKQYLILSTNCFNN